MSALTCEVLGLTDDQTGIAVALLSQFFAEEEFTGSRSAISENVRRLSADPYHWIALAWVDQVAVGIVTVTTMLYVEWGRLGEIGDLYVIPSARRRGIATALINAAKLKCQTLCCSAVSVVVTADGDARHGLTAFYEQFGFAGSGRRILTHKLDQRLLPTVDEPVIGTTSQIQEVLVHPRGQQLDPAMSDSSNTLVLPGKIFDVLQSFQTTAALRAAIELDVFTAIDAKGSSADDIAARCGVSARGARILCDYLCLTDLLQKRSGRYWVNDEAALYLDRRSDQFIGPAATEVYGGGTLAEGFQHLAQAVRVGGTALAGSGTLAPEHPYWAQFAHALAPIGAANAKLLAKLIGNPSARTVRVLDIACGHGYYGIALAESNPNAEIFALDWPAVLETAVRNAISHGIADRYHTIAGDAFSVALGDSYDLALLANFLPDLGPADCERLLTRVRSALVGDGRVVVLQCIPDEDRLSPPNGPKLALSLLVQTPRGDVYTHRELSEIFKKAGFVRTEIHSLGPSVSQQALIGYRD